jgi:hypothetical protein
MPKLKTVELHTGLQPYFYDVDNLPLMDLIENDNRINIQTDYNSTSLHDATGAASSLAAKLNVSMDALGNLNKAAVDATLHDIAKHSLDPTDQYVLMTTTERSKLSLAPDEGSTNLKLSVWTGAYGETDKTSYVNELVELVPSETINWVTSEQSGRYYVSAQLAFGGAYHQHLYGQTPTILNSPTNTSFVVPGGKYVSGSLRISINGFQIYSTKDIWVPSYNIPWVPGANPFTWVLRRFTEVNPNSGTFSLSAGSLYDSDQPIVDFDVLLT